MDDLTSRLKQNINTRGAVLDLRCSGLDILPFALHDFRHIKVLNVSGNPLRSLPDDIHLLHNLVELYAIGTAMRTLPASICALDALKLLALDNSGLQELPTDFGRLSKLKRLYLNSNALSSLPNSLGELRALRELIIHSNRLTELPPSISRLVTLRHLRLFDNRLSELPADIGMMRELETLDADDNRLILLPNGICDLSNLRSLSLKGNRLVELPSNIANLTSLEHLSLQGNPLPMPPEIVVHETRPDEVLHYYVTHHKGKEPTNPLREAKLIIVGQGAVGKTSLVRRLLADSFDTHEGMTEGINITNWHLAYRDQKIRLNVWDFGGQEIMHATHQFFLTKRSLYIFVMDSRLDEQENRIDYWMKIIASFGGDSPIIVVCNKCDQREIDLDWRGLMTKYRNIKAFIRRLSCRDKVGITELRSAICQELDGMRHVWDLMLNTWLAVKSKMEVENKDYMSYRRFVRVCDRLGVREEISQRTLVGFLHDLGIVLHFRDHPSLDQTNVLNPRWVTEGVYHIINSHRLFCNRGILEVSWLKDILDTKKYPLERHTYIIEMMQKFELCFQFEGSNGQHFLVPDLLQKEAPDTGPWNDSLWFQYKYNVLPASVISRFIVRMHAYISQNTYWRTGVVLVSEDQVNRALVAADLDAGIIDIRVDGPSVGRRNLLSIIRADFRKIHATISALDVEEVVPLGPSAFVGYAHLVKLSKNGVRRFWPEGADYEYDVEDVLDGVETRFAGVGLSLSKGGLNDMSKSIHIDNFQGVFGDVVGSQVTQNLRMVITKGNMKQLQQFLRENGVPDDDLRDLESTIGSDPHPTAKEFGPGVSSWIGRVMTKAAAGVCQLSLGTAGSLLANAIWAYYGM